jgi:hypothetical protein
VKVKRTVIAAAWAALAGPALAIDSGDLDCELESDVGMMSFTFAPVAPYYDASVRNGFVFQVLPISPLRRRCWWSRSWSAVRSFTVFI